METPNISIVTVGMNHLTYIKALFNSLFVESKPISSFEMIYVDNCSTDGSVDFVKENYPAIKIIQNTTPLGFGENNNKGAAIATGKYLAIINPDIVLTNGSLDSLYAFSESVEYEGIIAPQLLNPDKSLQYSVRGFMTPWIFILRFLTKGNDKFQNKTIEDYLCRNMDTNQVQFINWAIGASLFLKSSLYKKLNGFDTAYFMYVEDEDLCLRSWKMGNPVVYFPESKMIHNHLRGSSKLSNKTFIHIKSILTFFRKHGLFVKDYRNTKI